MRRYFIGAMLLVAAVAMAQQFDNSVVQVAAGINSISFSMSSQEKAYPIRMSKAQWQQELSRVEYRVLREEGTEYAFSSSLNGEKRKGIYYSRATGQPLFSSEHKYDSGTGWPSFWRPITLNAVDYHEDRGLFTRRVELVDSSSGSHLGHVFRDGPRPTNLRYCINGVSLIFVADGAKPPQIVRDYLTKHYSPTS